MNLNDYKGILVYAEQRDGVLQNVGLELLGNVICEKTTKNFNPLMAMAADTVIIEALEIVPAGSLSPEHLDISRIFIDYIVKSK